MRLLYSNINIATRQNYTRYVTFRKWRSIPFWQLFQILNCASRFWEFKSRVLANLIRCWATACPFFGYQNKFCASRGRYYALRCWFWAFESQPLGVSWCRLSNHWESIFGRWESISVLKLVDSSRFLGLIELIFTTLENWGLCKSSLGLRGSILNLWALGVDFLLIK